MLKIKKCNLNALYSRIAESQDLFLPVKTAGKTNYALWQEASQVDLDTLKTVRSAKDVFFPQSENLYSCCRTEGKLSVTPETLCEKPFVVFGMKGCDVRGIADSEFHTIFTGQIEEVLFSSFFPCLV